MLQWLTWVQASDLADEFVARAKESSQDNDQTNSDEDTHMIPLDLRKAKVTQVIKLLEREYVDMRSFHNHLSSALLTALSRSELVEGAQARLERLNISYLS